MRNLTNTELAHISGGYRLSDDEKIWGVMGMLVGAAVGNCFSANSNLTVVGALIGGLIGVFQGIYITNQCSAQ